MNIEQEKDFLKKVLQFNHAPNVPYRTLLIRNPITLENTEGGLIFSDVEKFQKHNNASVGQIIAIGDHAKEILNCNVKDYAFYRKPFVTAFNMSEDHRKKLGFYVWVADFDHIDFTFNGEDLDKFGFEPWKD